MKPCAFRSSAVGRHLVSGNVSQTTLFQHAERSSSVKRQCGASYGLRKSGKSQVSGVESKLLWPN